MNKKEKVTNFLEILDREVSSSELSSIFNNIEFRSIFISEYNFFRKDDNILFYKNFINSNVSKSRSRLQTDAIELAIAIGYYREEHYHIIKSILHSRRSVWLKLLCVDWLFNFKENILDKDYIEINNFILKKSNEGVIKAQVLINLLTIDDGKQEERIIELEKVVISVKDIAFRNRLIIAIQNKSYNTFVKNNIKRIIELVHPL